MPFCADRMMAGSASFSAAVALPRSPAAIASSTLRTKLRNWERRALLIAVRRAILRVALRAELVLAIPELFISARPLIGASRRKVNESNLHEPNLHGRNRATYNACALAGVRRRAAAGR